MQITASNQVRVGNTSVSSIGGQVGWTTFSDERIKTAIKEDIVGLDFIMRLRPVSYIYDYARFFQLTSGKPFAGNAGDNPNSNIRFSGFIAQEVEAAAKVVQYDFSGIDKPVNANTPYGIRYAEMVVPLVKAMQEMKQLIDNQQLEIEALKQLLKSK